MSAQLTPPGPPERRGMISSLGYYYRFYRDPIAFVAGRFERYGDVYYAPSGGVPLFVLRHPDHLADVLVKDAASYGKTHSALARLEGLLGRSLLTTDGDEWRRQRRMINPAFSAKRLAGYAETMADEASRCAARWHDGSELDASREMMELTLRVVCRTLFGHDLGNEIDTVAEAMDTFRSLAAAPDFAPSWLPTPHRRRMTRALADLDAILYGILAARRAAPPAAPNGSPPDLLQLLVDAVDEEGDGAGLSDREIRDHLVTLFIAGHETTSHALAWTWYLLARHPVAARRLQEELARELAGRAPRYDDLDRLPYTRQVIEEAMRLYPPAYSVARRAERDTRIGEWEVPQGSEVIAWIYFTHHDPRWYPEPEVFRPERFRPEEVAERPKLAYLPFGAGARACIGKTFAMIEAQILLATLAQRHRLELEPGAKVTASPRITLAPKGLRMRVRAS